MYILTGQGEKTQLPQVYVGESDQVLSASNGTSTTTRTSGPTW